LCYSGNNREEGTIRRENNKTGDNKKGKNNGEPIWGELKQKVISPMITT
jgi:hypothetical protein